MKNICKTMLSMGLAVFLFTGCENDLPVYEGGESWLKFEYEYTRDSIINYSFAYGHSSVQIDTVELELQLMGEVKDYDRPFTLKQVPSGGLDAVAGKHYVPFDDKELMTDYVLPAHATKVTVPVVLKRDPSLKEDNYTLRLTIGETGEFTCGSKERAYRTIAIADELIKPNGWDRLDHFFGTWGKVKHQFMIDMSGNKWDEEYVQGLVDIMYTEQGYLFYWADFFGQALAAYNANPDNDPPLREAGGEPVTFPF